MKRLTKEQGEVIASLILQMSIGQSTFTDQINKGYKKYNHEMADWGRTYHDDAIQALRDMGIPKGPSKFNETKG